MHFVIFSIFRHINFWSWGWETWYYQLLLCQRTRISESSFKIQRNRIVWLRLANWIPDSDLVPLERQRKIDKTFLSIWEIFCLKCRLLESHKYLPSCYRNRLPTTDKEIDKIYKNNCFHTLDKRQLNIVIPYQRKTEAVSPEITLSPV